MKEFRKSIYRYSDEEIVPPECQYRFLQNVQVSAVFGEVVNFQYQRKNGTNVTDTWVANGSGEIVYHEFGAGECIVENSLGIDAGSIIEIVWMDNIDCCPTEYAWNVIQGTRTCEEGYVDIGGTETPIVLYSNVFKDDWEPGTLLYDDPELTILTTVTYFKSITGGTIGLLFIALEDGIITEVIPPMTGC